MKQILTLAGLFFVCSLHAQSWDVNGNAGTTLSNKLGTTGNVSLRFVTNNRERMKIHANGGVGIGTPSPAQKLHVQGSAVFMNGSVGIGTTSPTAKLDIVNPNDFYGIKVNNGFEGFDDYIAVDATSVNNSGYGIGLYSTGGFYGVRSYGNGNEAPWSVYGVYGEAIGTAGSRYGIYGYATGGNFNAAGYFDGDVYAVNYLTISDRKFKTTISPLTSALAKVMRLKPYSYQFKKNENPGMALPGGEQVGLIADEVKQVFPQLVSEAIRPAKYGKKRSELLSPELKYESVNYIGLITVLISSIQEQQEQITALKSYVAEIDALKERLRKLEALPAKGNGSVFASSGYLQQNIPNPVSGSTVIQYAIPETATSAKLTLTNARGQLIKAYNLNSKGSGQVNINTSGLAAGTYNYTLWVENRQIDTRRLIVTR